MKKKKRNRKPRILIVTPEITYLPQGMGNMANHMKAKGGGLADVSATLVSTLFDQGVDIHVALPHYRRIFQVNIGSFISEELKIYKGKLPEERIHLAEDRAFYYRDQVYDQQWQENQNIGIVFQREVINNIIPRVRPDLIHCNDWMTGLIPGFARRLDIPSLFTLHNIHTLKVPMATVEDRGVDVAEFWNNLYFERMPANYEESRDNNAIDFLASGIFAGHYINTVSPTFLKEVIVGRHDFVDEHFRREIAGKAAAGCAAGILNSPHPSFTPDTDVALTQNYDHTSHVDGKRVNKLQLQYVLGLGRDENAPILFWPSRLDPIQKGCQLFAEILFPIISENYRRNLQVVVVANGPFQRHFHDIVRHHDLYDRIAVCDYDDTQARLAYAGSDFVLMPSRFEPCGLPQMIGQLYGSLPIAHDTGGIHDTVTHLNISEDTGEGFIFKHYDSVGLKWAIDQALDFHAQPPAVKNANVARIMRASAGRFNHAVTARRYLDIYENMLARPM